MTEMPRSTPAFANLRLTRRAAFALGGGVLALAGSGTAHGDNRPRDRIARRMAPRRHPCEECPKGVDEHSVTPLIARLRRSLQTTRRGQAEGAGRAAHGDHP